MKFTTTSQKAHKLGANATGMNMAKNRKNFSRIQKNNEDLKIQLKNLLLMIKKLQTKHIFWNTSENFMKHFSKHENKKLKQKWKPFFSDINILKLSENQAKLCEENLTEKDLYNSLKAMQSDKSPGDDKLTKEFYETFWTELKENLCRFYIRS